MKFNKKKLPLLLEKDGKVEPLSSFAFWSNADTKALSNAETLRDMEAIAIAEEIESLLKENVLYDGRRLRPSDIAILLQSASMLTRLLKSCAGGAFAPFGLRMKMSYVPKKRTNLRAF